MTQHEDPTPELSFRLAPFFGALLFALMVVSIGAYAVNSLRDRPNSWGDCETSEQDGGGAPLVYRQWDKPLVALVLTGQMHGYIDPCGCSEPQYGGLIRRYNFIQSLVTGSATKKNEKWDVVGVDLGEFAQYKGIQEQNLLKFKLTVQSLAKSNYRAFGIGADEILMPLGDALAPVWDKKAPHPRPISLSLAQAAPGQQYHDQLNARPWEIIDHTNPKIGVINILGPELCEQLKGQEPFVDGLKELPKALKAFADGGVEIGVILHHEYPVLDPKKFPVGGLAAQQQIERVRREHALACAKVCDAERKKNKKIPAIHLMMVLTTFSDPSLALQPLDDKLPTQIVEAGHKGKFVGLVGIYRDKKNQYQLKYQAVQMEPDFEPALKDKANHPIVALFDEYTLELKRQDVMGKQIKLRTVHFNQLLEQNKQGLKARYVGSERCGDCHQDAYDVWKDWKDPNKKVIGHARATETLEELKFPSNRNFDPECMRCHTTGMQNPTGYNDYVPDLKIWPEKQVFDAKKLAAHNKSLRGVGCESCHGPASEHEKNPNDKTLYPLINPFGLTPEERKLEALEKNRNAKQEQDYQRLFGDRMRALNVFCMKCHDDENDVHWGKPGHQIADKWIGRKLVHRTKPEKNNGPMIVPAPAKNGGPVIVQPPERPTIEVIDEKKK